MRLFGRSRARPASAAEAWRAAMAAAVQAFRDDEPRTAVAHVTHASWLAAAAGVTLPKDVADRAKRAVLDAAGVS